MTQIHISLDAPIRKPDRKSVLYFEPLNWDGPKEGIHWVKKLCKGSKVKLLCVENPELFRSFNPNSILDGFIIEDIGPSLLHFERKCKDYYIYTAFPASTLEEIGKSIITIELLLGKLRTPKGSISLPKTLEHNTPKAPKDKSGIPTSTVSNVQKVYNELIKIYGPKIIDQLTDYNINIRRSNLNPYPIILNEKGKLVIQFPDEDIELKVEPLPKALFIFLLRHPDGLSLREAKDYLDELLFIYLAMKSPKNAFPCGIRKVAVDKYYIQDIKSKEQSVFSCLGGGDYNLPDRWDDSIERHSHGYLGDTSFKNISTFNRIIDELPFEDKAMADFYKIKRDVENRRDRFIVKLASQRSKLLWEKSKRFPTDIFNPDDDNPPYYE